MQGSLDRVMEWLPSRLDEVARIHGVPGAVVAVLDDRRDEIAEVTSGVISVQSGKAATTDTMFALWSISKVYTTTLVMQLVDQGVVDLDAPVAEYLPDFRSRHWQHNVSVRQLLNHTSGLMWPAGVDFGREDDCVARCAATMSVVVNPPRASAFSYCNAGFIVAGAIVEHLTGASWDVALRDNLLTPLGLHHSLTNLEGFPKSRVASQHRRDTKTGNQVETLMWPMPRALGPAGSTLHCTAGDLIRFAQMHLREGKGRDGNALVSRHLVREMQACEVDVPVVAGRGYERNTGWGLGWGRYMIGDRFAVGHNGGTSNALRIMPNEGLAIAVLSNSMEGSRVAEPIIAELVTELRGVDIPDCTLSPSTIDVYTAPYVGEYVGADLRIEIVASRNGLLARRSESGLWGPAAQFRISMINRSEFEAGSLGEGTFLEFHGGIPRYLHVQKRSLVRRSRD